MERVRPESAVQFDELFQEFYDPDKKAERKVLQHRKERAENIKNDLGI